MNCSNCPCHVTNRKGKWYHVSEIPNLKTKYPLRTCSCGCKTATSHYFETVKP